MRFARYILAALLAVVPATAWSQAALLQGGPWTPGHVPQYVGQNSSQPIVIDGGPAGGGALGSNIGEIGITTRSPTNAYPQAGTGTGPLGSHFCMTDAPTNNATGYHFLCFDPQDSANAGLIDFGAAGTASTLPFNFVINGTTYAFPFTVGGIVGPGTSVVNDAACWNNLTGTLLKDCGAFVTVGGTNTWTGTNNFTGPFEISGVTETFPGSGLIVGTSDTQTLTNKSINASEVNSGLLAAAQMPALTGNVTTAAGSVSTTISAGVVANSMFVSGAANTIKGSASGSAEADLAVPSCSAAGNALQWLSGTGPQCATITANSAGFGLSLSTGVFSINTTQPPYGFDMPINMGLAATVGSSALTLTLVGANNSAISATNPVIVPFRSTTLATGTPVWTTITSPVAITIPSGATLGTSSSNVPFRIWVFLEYNAGTPELGVIICSTSTQIYPCRSFETTRQTTTTITNLSATAGTAYATTGVSNDAIRFIGFGTYESGLSTAGAWASVPTVLQLLGPGVPRPGETVQEIPVSTTTNATTTSTTFVPLTNGLTQNLTPQSAANLVRAVAYGTSWITGSATAFLQISHTISASTTLIGNPYEISLTAGTIEPSTLAVMDAPGVTSAVTYGFEGKTSANTLEFPPASTGLLLDLQEIMGSLDAPANDNGLTESRMFG